MILVCAFCPARRKTVRGIESHLLHQHPEQYRRAVAGEITVVYDVIH